MKSGKGSQFERDIAKMLSRWWTDGKRDDVFWRSQQSGGRATQRAKSGLDTANQQGDLQAMDSIGQPFIDRVCVELKCGYPKFSFDAILNSRQKDTLFAKFISQCRRETEGTERNWLLIVKQDFKLPVCVYGIGFVRFLNEHNVRPGGNCLVIRCGEEREMFMACVLEEFLKSVPCHIFGA